MNPPEPEPLEAACALWEQLMSWVPLTVLFAPACPVGKQATVTEGTSRGES
ncbi:hypothetical protein [Streptomyces sp. NPDC023588]|uniref:hypothetical protein n=1 Tax=Streptomyces sp. NPDC023588 TaxID=3154907 RepID=UPI0033CBB8A4